MNVPAEPHGNSAGGDFGYASGENDGGGGIGAGEAGGESEGNGEAVGNADDDIADYFAGGEVLLGVVVEKVLCLRFEAYSVFGGGHWCNVVNVFEVVNMLLESKQSLAALHKD